MNTGNDTVADLISSCRPALRNGVLRITDWKAPAEMRNGKPVTISVTIETPRGSRNKLKYEPAKKMYSLSKILPEGMVFPYDFGFVPSTKAEDGDPLDVLVLPDEPLFPGCLVACTLIGVIELTQEESGSVERNDRLIAVAQASLLYADVKDLAGILPGSTGWS